MVYKLLPFRNVRKVRLQIPVVEFLQIIKAKRRQLLLQSRQMVFPQVLVIYSLKLRLHRVQYLAPVVRPVLAPVEEVRPVVVVGRKPVIVIGKRYPYLDRIQQVPEIVDSLVEIPEPKRDVPIQLRYPGLIVDCRQRQILIPGLGAPLDIHVYVGGMRRDKLIGRFCIQPDGVALFIVKAFVSGVVIPASFPYIGTNAGSEKRLVVFDQIPQPGINCSYPKAVSPGYLYARQFCID